VQAIIKITLTILLLGCLINFPYGYYQFVRFVAMFGFAFLALEVHHKSQSKQVFIYVVLALLFQPFIKIALGRTIWNIVDVLVAIGLLVSLKINQKANE
jgi:hypothetical protein